MLHNLLGFRHLHEHRFAALMQQQSAHLLFVLLLILHELYGACILLQSFLNLLPCMAERRYCLCAVFSVVSHLTKLQQQSFAEQRNIEQEGSIGILQTVTVGDEWSHAHPELLALGIVHACQVAECIVFLIIESLLVALQGIALRASRCLLTKHHYLCFLAQHLGISPSLLCSVLFHSS